MPLDESPDNIALNAVREHYERQLDELERQDRLKDFAPSELYEFETAQQRKERA